MKRLASILSAVAFLAACGEDARYSEYGLAHRTGENSNKWQRCNYEFQLSPQATHSDLLQVLRANEIQICKWLDNSRVLGLRSGRGVQCQFNPVAGVHSIKYEATDLSAATNCETPKSAVPSLEEASGLQAFCFKFEIGGRLQTGDQLLGTGSSLSIYLGFPVRFVASDDTEGKVWVDLEAYPWPVSFARDVESATTYVGWDVEFIPCN